MGQHLRCAIYNKYSLPDIFATKRQDTWGRSRSILRMKIRHIFSGRHILGHRSLQAHFWPSLIEAWKNVLNQTFSKWIKFSFLIFLQSNQDDSRRRGGFQKYPIFEDWNFADRRSSRFLQEKPQSHYLPNKVPFKNLKINRKISWRVSKFHWKKYFEVQNFEIFPVN